MLCRYHGSLQKMYVSHPQLSEKFKKGMFGMKSISRISVDLTIEQTINADDARRLTGATF